MDTKKIIIDLEYLSKISLNKVCLNNNITLCSS